MSHERTTWIRRTTKRNGFNPLFNFSRQKCCFFAIIFFIHCLFMRYIYIYLIETLSYNVTRYVHVRFALTPSVRIIMSKHFYGIMLSNVFELLFRGSLRITFLLEIIFIMVSSTGL